MIIEHVYPKSKLILSSEYAKPLPEEESAVQVQGDPDLPVLDGVVFAIKDYFDHRVLFIDVDEKQDGAQGLAEWIQLSCEIGVHLVPPLEAEE